MCKEINSYQDLEKLIDCIDLLYNTITKEWKNLIDSKCNLKNMIVLDIEIGSDIYNLVISYEQFLNEHGPYMMGKVDSVCKSTVVARVKTPNSVEFKIQNYKTEKHENGLIPINKCFNDLFGVRIILDDPLDYEQVAEFIKRKYKGKYKCLNSSKGDYKATHIYFKKDNYTFPWELQVWNRNDENVNIKSHETYKQEYTRWEAESKEGGIANG